MMEDLVYRLRKRAEIRRQISTRKSVQEGKPDRIADLLEEAANEIERLKYPHQPYFYGPTPSCLVCGITGVNGLVCTHNNCPSRITCESKV